MVEILRRGEKPEERTYKASCRSCGSRLRFKRSEAKYHSDQRDGDFVSIACPVCNATINVAENSYQKQPSEADIKALERRQMGSF